jgi:hypothetical protein
MKMCALFVSLSLRNMVSAILIATILVAIQPHITHGVGAHSHSSSSTHVSHASVKGKGSFRSRKPWKWWTRKQKVRVPKQENNGNLKRASFPPGLETHEWLIQNDYFRLGSITEVIRRVIWAGPGTTGSVVVLRSDGSTRAYGLRHTRVIHGKVFVYDDKRIVGVVDADTPSWPGIYSATDSLYLRYEYLTTSPPPRQAALDIGDAVDIVRRSPVGTKGTLIGKVTVKPWLLPWRSGSNTSRFKTHTFTIRKTQNSVVIRRWWRFRSYTIGASAQWPGSENLTDVRLRLKTA